jgi:hypothetical protein
MLENNTVKGFVLSPYQAEYLLRNISEEFAVEADQTEPISVGIIFDVPPAYDDLRNCLRRRTFLRVLDNGAQLQHKLGHRREVQVTQYEAAEDVLEGEDTVFKLAVAAGAVAIVLVVAGVADLIVRKYVKRNTKVRAVRREERRTEREAALITAV